MKPSEYILKVLQQALIEEPHWSQDSAFAYAVMKYLDKYGIHPDEENCEQKEV